MSKTEFDIVRLKQLCDIDADTAIQNFENRDEYFVALDRFTRDQKFYLGGYTACTVSNIKRERDDFQTDLNRVRELLLKLDIKQPLLAVNELESAMENSNVELLEKWLNKFAFEMDKMADSINLSRKTGEEILKDEELAEICPLAVAEEFAPQCSLAVAEEIAPQRPVAVAEEIAPQRPVVEKPLILAVDDKPELLTTIVNMLEDKYKVMAATNGKTALRIIERHPPELFLLDIEMPQMNGYDLALSIRSQNKFLETPIIFLTSKQTREDVLLAIEYGGNDYLVKPVNKDLLLKKISKNLKKK